MGAEQSRPRQHPEPAHEPSLFGSELFSSAQRQHQNAAVAAAAAARQATVAPVPESEKLAALKGRLTDEHGMQYAIPTNQQAERAAEEVHGTDSWQSKTLLFLNRRSVQMALAGLLLLDVFVLFVELALLSMYPPCHTVERDAISCCPPEDDKYAEDAHHLRWLAGGGDICEDGLVPMEQYDAGCDDHKWHVVHRAEEFLFGITMFVLSTFFVELLVTIWAISPSVFFRQAFYVTDFSIVTISIGLELTFHYMDDDAIASMVGLLILGRLWRFVRIGHGIVELVSDTQREKYEELLAYAETLERLLVANNIALPDGRPAEASSSSRHLNVNEFTDSCRHGADLASVKEEAAEEDKDTASETSVSKSQLA